ncbi:MAG: N-acyl-D-amino-acid deacylase family protein [Bacteroidales bacterium]
MIRSAVLLAGLAGLFTIGLTAQPRPGQQNDVMFDLIIAGGRVVDGTGTPWFRADVGVRGDRIAAIGDLAQAAARGRIDATNLVVAPGFIDMLGQSEFNVLVDNRAASKITQGVTTEVTGEGSSIAPVNDRMLRDTAATYSHFRVVADWRTLGEYFARLDQRTHPAINVATFVGAGGLRDYVIGRDDRPATPSELEQMKSLAAQAMEDGALGVSSSLQYVPDRFASTAELVALAKVARRYGGIYITHRRWEGSHLQEAIDEVVAVATQAQIPAEIYHLKAAYRQNWGKMPALLQRLEQERARGIDITADMYPYTRSSNSLDACLPPWVHEGGVDKMIARLKDPALRERIKRELADAEATSWENQWAGAGGGAGILLVAVLKEDLKKFEGMTLDDIGRQLGLDPRDALMNLVVQDRGNSAIVASTMNEDDVRAALKSRLVSIGTDSGAKALDGPMSESRSHPRGWGSFPRVLGKYVREEGLLPLEEAIRKMTSQPAARVHLDDRGILRPGMAADITVFDPETIRDRSTFDQPAQYSEGVKYVVVNGRLVVSNGAITGERPGRALRGPGASRR